MHNRYEPSLYYWFLIDVAWSRDSVVSIAIRYGPGIEYRWGRDFPHVSFPGLKRQGRGVDYPPPSSAGVKERVDLYLCSLSGPSWHVLG